MSSVTTVTCDKCGSVATDGSETRCVLLVGKSGAQDHSGFYDVCADCCPVATPWGHDYNGKVTTPLSAEKARGVFAWLFGKPRSGGGK